MITMTSYQQYFIVKAIAILLFIVIACNGKEEKGADDLNTKEEKNPSTASVFDKLLGTWANENGKSFERWTKNEDGTYRSVVFIIKGNDTVYTDQIIVSRENDKWISENTVVGQNEGQAIKFKETLLTGNSIQFSNPAHDFPTDVNYTVMDANTVHAFIIGPNNKGGRDTIPFNYIRVR